LKTISNDNEAISMKSENCRSGDNENKQEFAQGNKNQCTDRNVSALFVHLYGIYSVERQSAI